MMRQCLPGTVIDYNIVVIVANPDRRVDDRLENAVFAVVEDAFYENPSLYVKDYGHAAQGLEYVGFTLNQESEDSLIPFGFAYQTWQITPLFNAQQNGVKIMPKPKGTR